MPGKYLIIFFCFSILLGFSSCASSGNLGGGPKDVTPPKMDTLNSDKNYQTMVNKKEFVFKFNEFIQVRDVVKQVLVSPPLVYLPKVKARGKQVEFLFNEKEILKENTTYIINFGEAISDFTEGNKLKAFKFVFSTGSDIDSLSLNGKVVDDKGKAAKDVLVMLYDDLSDSIVLKKKPYYYAKTDENGNYSFHNLKTDTFKIIALKDDNSNLLYNEINEAIGFADHFISWDSSNLATQNLSISKAEVALKIIDDVLDWKGKIALKLATKSEYIPPYTTEPVIDIVHTELSGDSILFWYDGMLPDSLNFIFDGFTYKIKSPSKYKSITKLTHTHQLIPIAHVPTDTLKIIFSQPIRSMENEFISVTDTNAIKIKFQSIVKQKILEIIPQIKSNSQYHLTILPGAVHDLFGNQNDSIGIELKTIDVEKLSTINLKINSLDSTEQYIVQLWKGNSLIRSNIEHQVSSVEYVYKNLKSDDYTVTVIEDKNKNSRKDLADYWTKRKPEVSKSIKLEKLRESWILDQELDYNTLEIPSNTVNEPIANPKPDNKLNTPTNTNRKQ